jgi:hypothetical protein
MRRLVVSLVVVGAVSLVAQPVAAGPPADVTAYCRATQPSTQAQVRCLFTERSAQDRAIRARASAAPDAWARCESGSVSWTDMASCLGQGGTSGGVATSVGGAAAPSAAESDEARPEQGRDAAPSATAAAPAPSEPVAPPSAIAPSPSTVILGPRGTAASAASEPNRVTRPVTEAEAERHLKGVLERSGEPAARCTKTQYSGGWVTVCD